VLVICLDTLRADHVGAYGYPLDTSPTLDRLAAEGTLFEWTIAPAEATLPSHVSIFTSRLPSSHGVWNHHHELTDDQVTLAEVFREEGYRTAAFVDAGHLLGLFGFTQGFDRYHDRYKRLEGSVDLALDWLEGVSPDDRFFLFVHGYDVHAPYAPWSPYRDQFVDPDYASDFEPTVDVLSDICWRHRQDPSFEMPLTEEEVAYAVACYDAALRWADDQVARLLDRMQADGRLKDTWVMILSDHGEEFAEHGSFQHDKLYLTVTHVPWIVRPPEGDGRWARAHRASGVTSLLDVFPTLLELVGVVPPVVVEGRSRVAELRGESSPAEAAESEIAYSQTYQFGHQRAVVTPRLHLLSSMEAPDSLDILAYREDRWELDPTHVWFEGDSVRHQGPFGPGARTVSGHLRQWMIDTAPGMEGRTARRLLGSDFQTLRNLGYIQ
jgi:arylsulfatase A-like enzyme